MGDKELILEGHNYQGRFSIEERTRTWSERVDTEVGYYNRTCTSRRWEGKGVVKDKQTGKEQKFLIYPDGDNESDLVLLGNNEGDIMKRVQDYEGLIDLALQDMYETAEKSKDILAEIHLTSLNIEKLVELGYIKNKNQGEISL